MRAHIRLRSTSDPRIRKSGSITTFHASSLTPLEEAKLRILLPAHEIQEAISQATELTASVSLSTLLPD